MFIQKGVFYLVGISLLALIGCKTTQYPATIKSRFLDANIPPAPDYALQKNWAALPQLHDPSDSIPNAFKSDASTQKVDVFWIHPTTYTGPPDSVYCWNASIGNAALNHKTDYSTILYQASVFNQIGNIYAPRYRQAHYYSFLTPFKEDKWKALHLAYTDVAASFQYFLNNYYKGGPIIIAAHSQGSIHAYWLLRDYFNHKPLMNKLVAAYLIGMPILTDSLSFILPCTQPLQTNCYLAWNTFKYGFIPIDSQLYQHTFCINPITFDTAIIHSKRKMHRGGILFNFNQLKKARVDAHVHNGLLWIHKPLLWMSLLYRKNNYHIGDYNLFYANIRHNIKDRVQSFYNSQPLK